MRSGMMAGEMRRAVGTGVVIVGLSLQAAPSMAWAKLREVDPALDAAVEALIAHDPAVANDPELAQLCRDIAEATVADARERAAVTHEVVAMQHEGVDPGSVIPTEVRDAAREQFAAVQGQMREQLETLRATDPEKAKEVELMMREGERQMEAFASGEHYLPSPEMVEHAKDMFQEWKDSMTEQGASPEMLARAEMEFAHWSGGEMTAGPGANMPNVEQMEQMVANGQMTSEQLQMAKDYMANPGEFMSAHPGYEALGPDAQGPGGPPEGTYGPAGGGDFHEYAGMSPTDAFEHWAADNPNVSPEQMEQYREMAEQYQYEPPPPPENQNYDNTQQTTFENSTPPPGGSSPPPEPPPQPEVLVAIHDHNGDGFPDEFHYDTNGDGIADHAHPTPH